MAENQFEINRKKFIGKCLKAIILGSFIPAWMFIIWNYFSTIIRQGYYSAPVSMLEMNFLCIPAGGYQLPVYLVSGMIGISLVKGGWIKSAMAAYLGVGVAGWTISSVLLSIMSINSSGGDESVFALIVISIMMELPGFLLYLWFLFPKPVDENSKQSD
jgi:hypothetical protein